MPGHKEHVNSAFVDDTVVHNKPNDGSTDTKSRYSRDLSKMPENYDPYLYRKVTHPTTNLETLFHLLKGCIGTGILAMPKAIHFSGYVLGSIGTIFIGFVCTYCVHLLVKCEYELCKRNKIPSLTYPGIAKAAFAEGPKIAQKFAPLSGHMVNVFLFIYEFGACCVYIVFVAVNIQAVANFYVTHIAIEWYIFMLLLPLIFMNWIRNLKRLVPLSTIANFITIGSFAILLFYIFRTGVSFENKEQVGSIQNLPLYFGIVLYALEAIGVIIPLENEMKTPNDFDGIFGVLAKGMTTSVLLYAAIGLLGYLSFGINTEAPVTLNLPQNEILAQVVKLSLALAIFISYSLQFYVAIDIVWIQYIQPRLKDHPKIRIFEYCVRTVLVLMTVVLAATIPSLDLFTSLVGAFSLSAVGIAIPAAIESCTFWYHKHGWRFYLMILKNMGLIIFAILGLVTGTYISLSDIINTFI